MSGRKSSEVASVLKSFEDSQDKIIAKYSKDIDNLIKSCEKIVKDLDEIDKNTIEKTKFLKEELNNKIKENRQKSNVIRNSIKNNPHYCDKEYAQATDLKNSNNILEKKFSDLSIETSNELTKLNVKYNKKLEDFWKIELDKLNNRLTDKDTFYNIKAYCIDGDENYRLTLEEFLKLYTSENIDEIKRILSVKSPSNFEEATDFIIKTNNKLGEFENKALNKLKKLETEVDLCKTIIEAMESLGFEVDVNIIDGNINNGYRVNCQNGDGIDFTNVKVAADGSPIIEIDHHSGKNFNNCGVKWEEIKKKFNDLGVPMTTVRKNGNDIIYGNQKQTKISNLNKVKGR